MKNKLGYLLLMIAFVLASQIYGQQGGSRTVSINDPWLDQLAKDYRRSRNLMVREAIPVFNKRLAAAVAQHGAIFEDNEEFEPMFKREWRWCTESTTNMSKAAPVSDISCTELVRTYGFTSENYDHMVKHGVPIVPPPFLEAKCRMEYPQRAADNSLDNGWRTVSVPGMVSARRVVHVCDLKSEEHDSQYVSHVGDLEVERKAWQIRKASRTKAVTQALEDRSGLPLIDGSGKLDMGVYECDPANWQVIHMLHDVGLIRKLEQPFEPSGGNIRAWCKNSARDIPEVCKWESHQDDPNRAKPCRQAGKYWKFTVKTFKVRPSICDDSYDKAYRAAEANGVKFTRFYDPQDQVCKVRFARRKAAAGTEGN